MCHTPAMFHVSRLPSCMIVFCSHQFLPDLYSTKPNLTRWFLIPSNPSLYRINTFSFGCSLCLSPQAQAQVYCLPALMGKIGLGRVIFWIASKSAKPIIRALD